MRRELSMIEPVGKDNSYKNLIAYTWSIMDKNILVVVNFSTYLTQGHVRIKGVRYSSNEWTFRDLLTEEKHTYKGEDLDNHGLYVDLDAWRSHIFDIKRIE